MRGCQQEKGLCNRAEERIIPRKEKIYLLSKKVRGKVREFVRE